MAIIKDSESDRHLNLGGRNINIEAAVDSVLSALDKLIDGEPLASPVPGKIKAIFDRATGSAKGSVRLAVIFFIAYSLISDQWNFESIPVGIRGGRGDKKLAAGLTLRYVNFHMAVTAFGENLGWKGNVRNANLTTDPRFQTFIGELRSLSAIEKFQLFNQAVWTLFQTRAVPKALPTLPEKYLTYSRSLALCEDLVALPTGGHVQQFLVAAFLTLHRRRIGNTVKTHHPHASDKFDNSCGDIEEQRGTDLVAAYEVTVRDDWKNRLPDFQAKMARGGLSKYVIIASNIHTDPQLSSARKILDFTRSIEFDLAIVDIRDFFSVFCAELTKDEISLAINLTYEFLIRPDLCGIQIYQNQFQTVVEEWTEIPLS